MSSCLKTNGDTDLEGRLVDMAGEKEAVGQMERIALKHRRYYI